VDKCEVLFKGAGLKYLFYDAALLKPSSPEQTKMTVEAQTHPTKPTFTNEK
jgi:hypothetical protein